MNILFVADVVGVPGRAALETRLKDLRAELDVDLCVVNGENAADGVGLTPKLARKLLEFGADAITLGNHTWRRPDLAPWIDSEPRVVRPANLSRHAPGRGLTVVPARDETQVAVINVMGSLFLDVACSAFELIDELVDEARAQTPVILVDMHAEATSEKVALSRWLDGRVTAVIGTHTHIQTNDARVQPAGTAALTDAGMTGPHDSVIGVTAEQAISRMRTGLPVRFETAQGDVRIEGALVECGADGRATRCETIRVPVP
jgi:2',3'-cyclic-nucleotide 2'-phosphodiesterase